MVWSKIKIIFCPNNNYDWMKSHAANPFAIEMNDGIFRIFFTCRNLNNQSHIGYVDVDLLHDFNIVAISEKPVLSPGEPGLFDDSGTALGYIIDIKGKLCLYYVGWNLKVTVPWMNTIGLAIFESKKNQFQKISKAPIMDRSDEDPFSISYPSILYDNGIYRMWYGSNLAWGKEQHQMKHVIKYAESSDGILWNRTNKIILNFEHINEYALSKPFVIKDASMYKMWYSYRANGSILNYRIGYAESSNGFDWIRKDNEVGIDVSNGGWDSDMIEYPFVFDYNNNRYMLYNGNGFGQTGFGIAILNR